MQSWVIMSVFRYLASRLETQ